MRLFTAFLLAVFSAAAQPIGPVARRQIAALLAEKASRTPAERKMDSHLVHAAKMLRGEAVHPDFPNPPGEMEAVRLDARNVVEVDITADVNPSLLAYLRSLGGQVVNSFAEYRSIRARVPLARLEQLAGRDEVQLIRVADPGHSNSQVRRNLRSVLRSAFFLGPDVTGDVAHQANVVRANSHYDGTGITIGVLSDGTNSLAAEQAAGRLPAVKVIASGSGDEGTAMLEIVYSLAPGATLLFATSTGGQANMANNIQALAKAGCQIIIDDWTYFGEGVFQDDIVAREVNTAAAGVFYFTDAQNSGSVLKGNSGTWEGDFADSGTTIPAISGREPAGFAIHNFGGAGNGANSDALTALSQASFNDYELKWSDPLLGSSNDYDLFILDSTLSNVLASSTNIQSGTQNPEESIYLSNAIRVGSRIVIVKHGAAAVRALHLDTERGILTIGTTGATFGHNAAAGAFSMAAVNVQSALGGAFVGGSANPTYVPTSDGPRRMFFNADGTAITPGNFTFGGNGGTVLNKPDFTAADGVTTGVPGYLSFFGTSAAGPHAGAIAALVLQAVPGISVTQMREALMASALDIEGPGWDINSGAGIVMAPGAVAAAPNLPVISLRLSHSGSFLAGQTAAPYTATVGVTGTMPLSGTVAVNANLPKGLSLNAMSGSGWICAGTVCSRSDGLAPGAAFPAISLLVDVATDAAGPLNNLVTVSLGGQNVAIAGDPTGIVVPGPSINPGGIVPIYSTSGTIESGSWASIYGTNLAPAAATWNGDYPTRLGGTTVTVNGKPAYLWYVGPNQINMEAPDDTTLGPVTVAVTTAGGTASATVNLGPESPSFNLFGDNRHIAGVIMTNGTGAYGGGSYDFAGPPGIFPFVTRPVAAGETLLLFGTGFGPANPAVPSGQPLANFSNTVNPVEITIGGVPVTPVYSVIVQPGAYQFALVVPTNVPSGDQLIRATVAGVQTQGSIYLAVQ